ncbi:potassium transporter 5-like [Telopea speciosissima]|uniref:potassium transporter 5-like n=1 Tax=Telopea speciosissima TaxID=54955 RepID=UPI001CC3AF1A|nr:potassium transporter 5-like [Telopea speciosissima]XP_043694661.1 potassium transporter 5-like [Telopea speciosissima]
MAESNEGSPPRKNQQKLFNRVDSLHLEAGKVSGQPIKSNQKQQGSWGTTLSLAFQCIGVVYGDVGTSPLYTYSTVFANGIGDPNDLIGVLSLIIYTLTLVTLIKYCFIVLWANDNGDGGTFAIYSKICRHVKVSLIPNYQKEDATLSNYSVEVPSTNVKRAQKVKETMENSPAIRVMLFMCAIVGTSMVMGDGVLTPAISVLSAVGGITVAVPTLSPGAIVGISIVILILLFVFQRYGTDKVGFAFAPLISLWFLFIAGIGLYNLIKYDITVLRAFNPAYIIDYFKRNGTNGYMSLGGVVLCITGTEAMFADLGHFNIPAIQISFGGFVYPALILAYSGQAAYLTKYPNTVQTSFYSSIPGPLYWPQFVIAIIAAAIASQAMISGSFSIVAQSQALGCFPKVKIIHTSKKYEGQVYIPEVNYALMLGTVIITAVFQNTIAISFAYGICVVTVMVITTTLVSLIMLVIWKISILWISLFFVIFASIELIYLSATITKFVQGGWLPLAFAAVLVSIMWVWHYVYKEKYMFELENKVSNDFIREVVMNPNINRVPGIGLLYSELVQGIPPIFPHFISNIPSIHSVLVFVSIKQIPIPTVDMEERFLFRQVEPRESRMFRCVVRYGYKDAFNQPEEFEQQLVQRLKEFVRHENYMHNEELIEQNILPFKHHHTQSTNSSGRIVSTRLVSGQIVEAEEGETQFIDEAMKNGVVYLLGEPEVRAKPNSSFFKKIIVNYIYSFLKKNFRQGQDMMSIPRTRVLKVGMIYEI